MSAPPPAPAPAGKKQKKQKKPQGTGEVAKQPQQNLGQNQNQQTGLQQNQNQKSGAGQKKKGGPNKAPFRPTYQPHGGKTSLGLGEGKKYDQNCCLFISGVVLKEGESALKFMDNLLIDRMNLDFRANEIKRIDATVNKEGPKVSPPPGASGEESDKIIVAIFTSPTHVQEVLKKASAFKNSPENFDTFGHLQFEGYLNMQEQNLKAAMIKRVEELNRLLFRAKIGPESTDLMALVTSKNTYQHLGHEYCGEFHGGNSIVWKSYQKAENARQGPEAPKGNGDQGQSSSRASQDGEFTLI